MIKKTRTIKSLFLVFIFFIFLLPLLNPGIFISHDGVTHIVRIAAYNESILNNNYLVRWATDFNYSFGNPLFIFIYPLPYYLGSLIHLLGLSYQDSFKLILGLGFILAPFIFYLWVSEFSSKKTAFISSLFYVFAPHHLLDFYVRAGIGDIFGYFLIPLCFLSIEKIYKKPSLKYFLIGSFSYAFLILSHNGLAFMFSPLFVIYVFLRWSKKKARNLIFSLSFFLYGLFMSAFFWIPALFERKYLATLGIFDKNYLSHFPKIINLIYSPWAFGVNVNEPGGLSPQIGIIHVLIVLMVLFLYKKIKKVYKKLLLFWIIIFLISIFLSTSSSSILYERLSLLRSFQFPWRFLVFAAFSSSVISVFVLDILSERIKYIILVILLIYSYQFAAVGGYQNKNDAYYENFVGIGFDHGEGLTRWVAGNPSSLPKNKFEIIQGQGKVLNFDQKGVEQKLRVYAESNINILDNTTYYPGWKVFVDGKETSVEFQDINHRGLITFPVQKGNHEILIRFKETSLRLFSDLISFLSLLFLASFVITVRIRKIVTK
jgi:uncharacterized membrane protein